MRRVTETPKCVSERMMTPRVPLVKGDDAIILSCYAPTLDSDEDTENNFYGQLDRTLSEIRRSDKIILLGGFNARVGTDSAVWGRIIGKNVVGNMNSNGLRLLTLCAKHNLTKVQALASH